MLSAASRKFSVGKSSLMLKYPLSFICSGVVAPWFGKLILEDLTEYPQWLALYTGKMTYRYHFDMWQYTCTATVPGVSGDCDVNVFFPYDDLK